MEYSGRDSKKGVERIQKIWKANRIRLNNFQWVNYVFIFFGARLHGPKWASPIINELNQMDGYQARALILWIISTKWHHNGSKMKIDVMHKIKLFWNQFYWNTLGTYLADVQVSNKEMIIDTQNKDIEFKRKHTTWILAHTQMQTQSKISNYKVKLNDNFFIIFFLFKRHEISLIDALNTDMYSRAYNSDDKYLWNDDQRFIWIELIWFGWFIKC